MGIRDRMEAAREAAVDKIIGDLPSHGFKFIEVASWRDAERVTQEMSLRGWRLHTIRDGARGEIDLGYRLVFEKVVV